MYNALEFLHGKKAILFGLAHLTNALLSLKGVYDTDIATYIAGVLTLLAGGADYATGVKLGTTRK
jgi:hypothetical protein